MVKIGDWIADLQKIIMIWRIRKFWCFCFFKDVFCHFDFGGNITVAKQKGDNLKSGDKLMCNKNANLPYELKIKALSVDQEMSPKPLIPYLFCPVYRTPIVLIMTFENEFSGIIYNFFRGRQNVFSTMSST